MAEQLTEFVAQAGSYAPRRWAEEHISCFKSTERLNAILRDHAERAGREWTRDLVPLTWCPDPRHADAADADELAEEHRDFERRFGLRLGA